MGEVAALQQPDGVIEPAAMDEYQRIPARIELPRTRIGIDRMAVDAQIHDDGTESAAFTAL